MNLEIEADCLENILLHLLVYISRLSIFLSRSGNSFCPRVEKDENVKLLMYRIIQMYQKMIVLGKMKWQPLTMLVPRETKGFSGTRENKISSPEVIIDVASSLRHQTRDV